MIEVLTDACQPAPPEAETVIHSLVRRLQEKAADTIESLHKAGMKVWVLTGDKMETAAATCYASKLFHRSTQILELTKKRTEEQSLHDVLFELNRTVLRQRSMSGYDVIHAPPAVFSVGRFGLYHISK